MRHGGFLLWVLAVFALATSGQASLVLAQDLPPVDPPPGKPPNILLVLTDDQEASTLAHMPKVQEHLVAQGKTFENAIFTYPYCCPSRATMHTGNYSHNTGITSNAPPRGGFEVFSEKGLQHSTFATWLDAAGYDTGYFGKYMNGYSGKRPVDGWDRWGAYSGSVGMGWSEYTNGRRTGKTRSPVAAERAVAEQALTYMAQERDAPFLAVAAFGAPHHPYPHPKAADKMFAEVQAPRTEGFNEADVSDKPGWIKNKTRLGGKGAKAVDEKYRDALRSLVNVDRFVGEAVESVPENIIVLYWTDNGTHTGYHRLRYGKNTPYEQDINFPLLVSGPGVSPGTSEKLVGNHDLAPTLADLAGADAPTAELDGRSFAPLLGPDEPASWRDALLVEKPHRSEAGAPPWRAVRTEGETYVEYATGEREHYDLEADPDQANNLLHEPAPEAEARAAELSARLDALEGCAGDSCRAAEDGVPIEPPAEIPAP
jgi:N-acetylglucosamine-6-sulfatase